MSPDSDSAALDLSRAPRGELAAAQLIAAVAESGDLAERHYLELKGPPDLASKVNKAKVAKFILGAANRLPDRAAEAFEGYGVMIVGITKSGIEGVPPIEMLALSQVIQPFLGAAGPRWDIVRVAVSNSTNQVLVILVDPPQMGQQPFFCRANGEGLQNGRTYLRGDGDTREATADELDLLIARGAAQPPAPVELEVGVVGTVVPLIVDEDRTLTEYLLKVRKRLLDAIPGLDPDPKRASATGVATRHADAFSEARGLSDAVSRMVADQSSVARDLAAIHSNKEPEKRTEEEYKAEIDAWENRFREAWPEAIELFARWALQANEVTVANKTQTFLHDVEVKLHLDGAVETIGNEGHDDEPQFDLKLPRPPRIWGPTRRDNGFKLAHPTNWALTSPASSAPRLNVPSTTSWKTTGSVDVDIDVGDLRPEATFTSDDGESVLVIRGEVPTCINGIWTATARGYNEVFEGEVQVMVAEPALLTDMLRGFLGLE